MAEKTTKKRAKKYEERVVVKGSFTQLLGELFPKSKKGGHKKKLNNKE